MRLSHNTTLCCALCLTCGVASATAQAIAPKRYSLTTDAVVRALHRDGLDVNAAELRFPMALSTTISDPALELLGADRLPDGNLRMRLHCRTAGECLPFTVTLLTQRQQTSLVATASTPPVPHGAPALQPTATVSMARALPVERVQPQGASLAAGTRLTLWLEDGHMRIHVPVVTLENTTPGGAAIRVASPDHKQIYRALVLDVNTARGVIE